MITTDNLKVKINEEFPVNKYIIKDKLSGDTAYLEIQFTDIKQKFLLNDIFITNDSVTVLSKIFFNDNEVKRIEGFPILKKEVNISDSLKDTLKIKILDKTINNHFVKKFKLNVTMNSDTSTFQFSKFQASF